jgi:hypothetical protein
MTAIIDRADESIPESLAIRGYHAIYRQQQTNHCPGCGRTQWFVGRASAECCFCATALPFASPGFGTATPIFS